MASETTDGFGNKHLKLGRKDLKPEHWNQRWENVTLSCFGGSFARFFHIHRIYFVDDNGRVKILKDALGPYEYRVSWQGAASIAPNEGAGDRPHDQTLGTHTMAIVERARRARRYVRPHPYRR